MSTYYTTQPWADGPGGNTPVTAATLTHVETGLGSAHDRIDALAVGSVLIPTAIRTTATAPAAGQLVTYDASSNPIGPIPLPPPSAGVIMSVVKGDASTNTVTLTSGVLLGNGGSTSIVLRTVGESRALYGSASGWFVSGAHSPIVGTTAGTVAAGDDARFANTLTTALYGGPGRTAAPFCQVDYAGPGYFVTNSDQYASGGFVARTDADGMLGTVGGFAAITIPVNGTYEYRFNVNLLTSSASLINARITRNARSVASTIAYDSRYGPGNTSSTTLSAADTGFLAAGDQLYWGQWSGSASVQVHADIVTTGRCLTNVLVRYIGP